MFHLVADSRNSWLLLCSTLYFFTRHFDSLFDIPFFAAKRSSARRRRPSLSIHSTSHSGRSHRLAPPSQGFFWSMRVYFFLRPFVIGLAIGLQELVSTGTIPSETTTTKKPIFFILLIFMKDSVRKGSVLKPSTKECLINLHSSYADFFPCFYESCVLKSKTKTKQKNNLGMGSKALLSVRSILKEKNNWRAQHKRNVWDRRQIFPFFLLN